MKDKVFRGFIVTASAAMVLIIYGTYASDATIVLAAEIAGLLAAGIGWLGFVTDLRRDAKSRHRNIRDNWKV